MIMKATRRSLRWLATATAVAGLGVGFTAGPAAAQYPGANGARSYVTTTTWTAGETSSTWHAPGRDLPPCYTPDADAPTNVCVDTSTWAPSGHRALLLGQGDSAIDFQPGLFTWSTGDQAAQKMPGLFDTVDRRTQVSYSPDATQIAATHKGDVAIVSTVTGRVVKDLTPNTSTTTQRDPSWNPKGGTIAYSAPDGIRTVPAAGGASRLVIQGTAKAPDYSPDGTRILYTNGSGKLAYVTLATGTVTTTIITGAPGAKWSPDGRQVIFKGVKGCASATLTGTITWRVDDPTCTAVGWQPLR